MGGELGGDESVGIGAGPCIWVACFAWLECDEFAVDLAGVPLPFVTAAVAATRAAKLMLVAVATVAEVDAVCGGFRGVVEMAGKLSGARNDSAVGAVAAAAVDVPLWLAWWLPFATALATIDAAVGAPAGAATSGAIFGEALALITPFRATSLACVPPLARCMIMVDMAVAGVPLVLKLPPGTNSIAERDGTNGAALAVSFGVLVSDEKDGVAVAAGEAAAASDSRLSIAALGVIGCDQVPAMGVLDSAAAEKGVLVGVCSGVPVAATPFLFEADLPVLLMAVRVVAAADQEEAAGRTEEGAAPRVGKSDSRSGTRCSINRTSM